MSPAPRTEGAARKEDRMSTETTQEADAAVDRVRVMAEKWAALEGDGAAAEVDRMVGEQLLETVGVQKTARHKIILLTQLAESWLDPNGLGLFYPAAGQCVLDAIKGDPVDWQARALDAEMRLETIAALEPLRSRGFRPGTTGVIEEFYLRQSDVLAIIGSDKEGDRG